MLTIYHVPGTRGFRAIWACEELGTPYRIEPVDMSPAFRASPQWRQMNPVGKVPVMTDGELTMFESCAMVQYILDRYGDGRLQPPAGSAEHAAYLQWCWFSEATFSRPLGEMVNHRRAFGEQQSASVLEEMADRARLSLAAVNDHLADRAYLLGDGFSAADINMGYTVRMCERLLEGSLSGPVARYMADLKSRPAYVATEAADNAARKEA